MTLGNTFGYQSSDNNGTIPKKGCKLKLNI